MDSAPHRAYGVGTERRPLTIIEPQSPGVIVWWSTLSVISVLNIVAWVVVARRHVRDARALEPQARAARRWHLALSALFVVGCAFRSFLPRAEGQRICLVDSWISAAVISRAVATVAELAMVAQWTIFLREYARGARVRAAVTLSYLPLGLIAMAEIFSWYTTLTTNFIGSVVEESTWAVTASVMIAGFAMIFPRYRGLRRRLIGLMLAINLAYFMFMCSVDVPMYWSRFTADQALGKPYLSVAAGWHDASHRRVVTRAWLDWVDEMPWMSLYFTAGVWISIALVRTPPARAAERAAGRSQA
jgi:hypothetical protein